MKIHALNSTTVASSSSRSFQNNSFSHRLLQTIIDFVTKDTSTTSNLSPEDNRVQVISYFENSLFHQPFVLLTTINNYQVEND